MNQSINITYILTLDDVRILDIGVIYDELSFDFWSSGYIRTYYILRISKDPNCVRIDEAEGIHTRSRIVSGFRATFWGYWYDTVEICDRIFFFFVVFVPIFIFCFCFSGLGS